MKRWQITLVWARLLCVLLLSGAAVGQAPYATTTSISASGSTGNYTLTGTVSGPGSSTVYPTGSLSFLDTTLGGFSLGSASLGAPVFSQSFVQEPSVTGATTSGGSNAIGDFDGDGKGDYIVANFNAYGYLTLTLYLSKGDGTFQSGTTVFTDTNISSANVTVVVPGDFNKDGKLDVAVSVNGAATIVVLGNGDGTFQSTPSALLGAATNEVAMITGDFNGDRNLDIATVSGLTAAVYLGSGSGTFSNPKTMTISTNSVIGTYETVRSIVAGDFNGDGRQDLLVSFVSRLESNYGEMICLGNGDGSFQTCTFVDQSNAVGTKAVVGDFNGDGRLDFVLAGSSAPVWYGNGDGTFTEAGTEPSGTQDDVVVGDFNGDGLADYVGISQGSSFQVPVLTAFFGSTSRVFTTKTFTTTDSGTYQTISTGPMPLLVTGDINGDGAPDLAFYNGNKTATSVIVLDVITATSSAMLTNVNPKGSGTHNVDAAFPAEAKYRASTSSTVALTGTTIATSLGLSPNPTSSYYGQQVALTAVLNPYSYATLSTNGEAISFYGNGTLLGTANLSSGVATYQTTSLPIGTDTLTAGLAADGNFAASSASSSITVGKITPTITWATPAAITYGTRLSATQLNASSGGLAGTFAYSPASGAILNAGTQTLSVTFTPSDTTNYSTATGSVSLVVNKSTPTVYFTTDAPVTYGTPLIVDVFVSCGYACGNVDYRWDGLEWGTVSLDSTGDFAASRAVSDPTGSHTVQVNYLGDANHNAVNTTAQTYTINKAPTIAELTSSVNPITAGATTVLSTLVDAGGAEPPTGTVTWTSNGTSIGSSSLSTVTATNLVPYSGQIGSGHWQSFCGSSWSLSSVNTSSVTAPDGSSTATKIVMPSSATCEATGYTLGAQQAVSGGLVAGKTYVVSVWLRGAVGGEAVEVGLNDTYKTQVGLTTSWQRYVLVFSSYASGAQDNRGFEMFGTVANQTFYAWGAQTEQASALGPYVATGSGSMTGSGGVAQLSTNALAAVGSDAIVATYSGDTNDLASTSPAVTEVVTKATPTITWATPSAITYGTALSATQLNASSGGVAGTFVYSPAAGTILDAGTQSLSVTFTPTDATDYNTATGTVSLVVNQATPTVTLSLATTTWPYSQVNLWTLSANCTNCGAGRLLIDGVDTGHFPLTNGSYSGGFTYEIHPGTHTVQGGTTTGSTDYTSANGALQTVTVTKGTPVISWSPASLTYGQPLGTSQLNASAYDMRFPSLDGTFAYSPVAGTVLSAGTQTLSVTFTPSDTTDYNSTTVTRSVAVSKATPTITWATPAAITYGTALDSTQLNASSGVAGSFAYSPASGTVLGTGTQTLSVTFTPTDSMNYNTWSKTVSLVVNKAAPTITWGTPAAITYGTALGSTQLNASSGGVAGSFIYSPTSGTVLGAGTQTLSVTFTPTDTTDFGTASKTVSLTLNKAATTITWSAPAAITYGTALSSAQLNASSTTPGSLVYSPALGTVLAAGTQTLSVTFTPTDTSDYASATATVPLTVNQAAPIITWAPPSAITYGTPLSSTQLNASSGTSGTFTYSPIAGTVLATGIQTLSVTFTPKDTIDYNSTTATISLTVNKAATTISVTSMPNPAIYGDQIEFKFVFSGTGALPTGQATVTDGVKTLGIVTINGSGVAIYRTSDLAAGAHVLTATYMGDANYQ